MEWRVTLRLNLLFIPLLTRGGFSRCCSLVVNETNDGSSMAWLLASGRFPERTKLSETHLLDLAMAIWLCLRCMQRVAVYY
jgi:hypothetical protein